MNYQAKNHAWDYRVNTLNNGAIISIEITCCGKHIGEMRFKDGESRKCPVCGTEHLIMIEHNHFHIRPVKPAVNQAESLLEKVAAGEG
ncbi:MAG: hypothetical protein K6T80_00150 [Firmicutes bacterium]|nr:hypothetical protein [Bacillota bacterium]